MYSFTAALESLTRLLTQEISARPGIRVIDVPFPLNDAFDALSWLASQPVYPQFYWQQRNGDEEAAVLGAVCRFSSLDEAQRFLHQHPQQTDLRIWGLNAFDPRQGFLFLPRLEWRRCAGVATLRLHLCSAVSLREDTERALTFLTSLAGVKPLSTLRLTLTAERRWPEKAGWISLIRKATDTIAACC